MSAACVCMVEGKWRCGVHGVITPAMRAAARYGREHGEEKRAEQEAAAAERHVGCGERRDDGHHPLCSEYEAPVAPEVHPAQEALL